MRRIVITIVAVLLVAGAVPGAARAKTIYVDADATGADNGTNWPDAYKFLQDALADANDSAKPVEIRVAHGVYRPDESGAEPNGTGDRFATFLLVNGLSVKGGYAGFGAGDPNARDIEVYETVLSGDLDGNDVDVNDLEDLRDEPSRADNAYHVVTSRDSNESAVLDGMTITGGNANGDWPDPWPYEERGGGMYNEGGGGLAGGRGSPQIIDYAATISNCTFVANSATFGGGMYNYQIYPKVSHCSFIGNSASSRTSGDVSRGGVGGGMHNQEGRPMVTACVFSGNWGGGMLNEDSNPVVCSCAFRGNRSSGKGGGMCNKWSNPQVRQSLFSGNWAGSSGGGMANHRGSPLVVDCIFSDNRTLSGGGIYNSQSSGSIIRCIFVGNSARGGGMLNERSDVMLINCLLAGNRSSKFGGAVVNMSCEPVIANCTIVLNRAGEAGGALHSGWGVDLLLRNSILWCNSAPEGAQIAARGSSTEPSTISVEHSTIMGGDEGVSVGPNDSLNWGAGNIDCDPCFADLGYWDPNGTAEDANDDYWVMGDYHLKSQGGRWDANEGRWTVDEVTSPCIDTGDPMTPIGAEPFPNGGRINMGAYGGTAEASKSYSGPPSRLQITHTAIIRGELIVIGYNPDIGDLTLFEAIEEVEAPRVGEVFLVKVTASNVGAETVYVSNFYGWEVSPGDKVEVVGSNSACQVIFPIEPGQSRVLYPFCPSQAFEGKHEGTITMRVYKRGPTGGLLCEYTFDFEILESG